MITFTYKLMVHYSFIMVTSIRLDFLIPNRIVGSDTR